MSTGQAVRLRTVLDDLENNRIGTADAAAEVRTTRFPVPPPKTIAQRMAEAAENDMPPMPSEGGFHEVALVYLENKITLEQYKALAEAAAEAM